MYKMKESEDRLNHHATLLNGKNISFRVYYWGLNPCHYDNPVHKHSFFEVCYVMKGNGTYMDNNIDYELNPGTFFCSRPGITHQIRSENGLMLLFVAFEVNENQTSIEEVNRFHLLSKNADVCIYSKGTSAAALLWQALLINGHQEWSLRPEQLSILSHTLISSFTELFMSNGYSRKQPSLRTNSLLKQSKLFVRDNLDQPLSLESVSAYLHVSKRHLSRLFAEGIHETFSGFVRQERINKAVHLFESTDLSIKEIALTTGFSSVHSFTRAFTAEKRIPPGKFRRMIDHS